MPKLPLARFRKRFVVAARPSLKTIGIVVLGGVAREHVLAGLVDVKSGVIETGDVAADGVFVRQSVQGNAPQLIEVGGVARDQVAAAAKANDQPGLGIVFGGVSQIELPVDKDRWMPSRPLLLATFLETMLPLPL